MHYYPQITLILADYSAGKSDLNTKSTSTNS